MEQSFEDDEQNPHQQEQDDYTMKFSE